MSKKLMSSKSLSPEELVLRAVRARRRFKALVRKVIANLPWLQDEEDDYTPKSVKKYMQTLTRKKPAKGLLSLQEKSILCKPAEDRSEAEKLLLYRIIGGLKCFRKYPENVKMQLAGLTYFIFYPAGRVIVRQNQEAHSLFFIISGEVAVSVTSIDPIFKEEVTVNIGAMVAGSMFGEVSLLHDIPRTGTITTITPCELLCLKKADFDIVLKASVSQEWAEIQKSMQRFEYFKGWDEISVRECCLYSKIKTYARDQVVLGEGFGSPSSCYFILKGRCRIIEHLLVEVSYDKHGRKRYKLYESSHNLTTKENIGILDEKKDSSEMMYKLKTSSPPTSVLEKLAQNGLEDASQISKRDSSLTAPKNLAQNELESTSRKSMRGSTLTKSENLTQNEVEDTSQKSTRVSRLRDSENLAQNEVEDTSRKSMSGSKLTKLENLAQNEVQNTSRNSKRDSILTAPQNLTQKELKDANWKSNRTFKPTGGKSKTNSEKRPVRKQESIQISKDEVAFIPLAEITSFTSRSYSLPPNIETHFMQVCILSETACFAIGENFNRRNVVAMSDTVECLVIPYYWLMQRNKGNIWTRIKQYLDQKIPSTKEVFHEFMEQRKWNTYKKKLFCDLFGKPPQNAYYNVPYSIRIKEDIGN